MKIGKKTLTVLNNFSSINNSIIVDEEGVIKTIDNSESIVVVYETEEKFKPFSMYDLGEFLSLLKLFNNDDMEVEFKEDHVIINDGNNEVFYAYTEKSIVPIYESYKEMKPSKVYLEYNEFDASIDISSIDFNKVQKVSNILQLKEIVFDIKDGAGYIYVKESEDDLNEPSLNKYKVAVNGKGTAKAVLDMENLNIIAGDYTVFIKDSSFVKFQHKSAPLIYFIAPKER